MIGQVMQRRIRRQRNSPTPDRLLTRIRIHIIHPNRIVVARRRRLQRLLPCSNPLFCVRAGSDRPARSDREQRARLGQRAWPEQPQQPERLAATCVQPDPPPPDQ